MSLVIRVTDFAAPELDVYARTTENQLVCREDPKTANSSPKRQWLLSVRWMPDMFRSRS